jgi:hypothetical protein
MKKVNENKPTSFKTDDVSLEGIKKRILETGLQPNQTEELLELKSKDSDLMICYGTEEIAISELIIPDYYCRESIEDRHIRLEKEIQSKGFVGSIVVNHHPKRGKVIIDGVARLEIMQKLGATHIPVQFIRTVKISVEKSLVIDLNTSVNDFDMEEFGLNFQELDLEEFPYDKSEYGFDDNEFDDKDFHNKETKNKVLKNVKIGTTFEEFLFVNKALDWYKKEHHLKNRAQALIQILSKILPEDKYQLFTENINQDEK